VQGKSGLDGTDLLPKPVKDPVTDVTAIAAMYDALIKTPESSAWLVTTGTMTNAALLFAVHPDLADHIGGVSVMGGGVGNLFTHAPMGRYSERIELSPKVWREYPQGPPDMPPVELARLFREEELALNVEGISDEKLGTMLMQQRKSCGNFSQFAEFNVSLTLRRWIED
jgi:hypothetical protein